MNTEFPKTELVWQTSAISRSERERQNGHRAKVVWLTGLPGSGKSTLAHGVENVLHRAGMQTVVLDGDNVRHGLCADLGFSLEERNENVRRVGQVAKLFLEQGIVVLVALVSPINQAREQVKALFSDDDFMEVYCKCSIEVCQHRDPKGMYAKAKQGQLSNFTGVSAQYEPPVAPSMIIETAEECADQSIQHLSHRLLAQLTLST